MGTLFDDEHEKRQRFILDVLFTGLINRNTGFDEAGIPHVTPEDFQVVLDRCESAGGAVIGVEIFDVGDFPRTKVEMLDVVIRPEPGFEWARRLTRQYSGQPRITFSATFNTPEQVKHPERLRKAMAEESDI